ncbi:hypothetical protein LZD49_25615 [Dyadobacter sp. CY261]|uniref:hypothetical protein n=1 Tax=Dyadobacter sp. CY261 TaxID=2907203 RepID=UPI001F475348|nr:hypothetical protein [Dyadobacter sp. CY261]MCF0073884.1 hypothetical protein [Dyadobacter sp. CY261]
MKILLLVYSVFCHIVLLNDPLNVAGGTAWSQSDTLRTKPDIIYLFPAFVKGTVYFRNGTKREALLNYHRIRSQVRFLSPKADTLVFTGKYLIDHVEMSGRTFLLSEERSDMEVISTAGAVMLAAQTQPEPIDSGKSHSGQQFSASASNTGPGLLVNYHRGGLEWQNNSNGQSWGLTTAYFLIDHNKVIHPTSRRAFLTVYGRHKRQVTRYIRENRPDFASVDDLQRLLAFCAGLTAL